MSKYSKIFFGQKEYYDIAPFRFPIYKDLVAGEIEGIEDVARKQAKNTYALLKIAKDIAVRKDIPVQEALDALSDVNENQEVLYDYVDQLADIQTNGQSASEQKILTVTLFMKYRAELKEGKKWVQTLIGRRPIPEKCQAVCWTRSTLLLSGNATAGLSQTKRKRILRETDRRGG